MGKFHGTLEELKALVADLGYRGEWIDDAEKRVFRSADGALLNWWPSTHTWQAQGPSTVKTTLNTAISTALSDPSDSTSVANTVPTQRSALTPSSTETAVDSPDENSKRVFVVHGHDQTARTELQLILHQLNLDPLVLADTGGQGLTIIEALEKEMSSSSGGKRFGIVLLTPDDMGYEREKTPKDAEPRARQNVVMEMGMLIAAFGRHRVAILRKGQVSVPSDANGIIYLGFADHVNETAAKLCKRLTDAGFELKPEAVAEACT